MSSLSGTRFIEGAVDEQVRRSVEDASEYGKWYSVYSFARWSEQGVWEKMHPFRMSRIWSDNRQHDGA